MEHEGLTFVEAVKRLAEAAGIRIEEEAYDANAERVAKERQALLKVHKEITEWYHSLLMRHKAAAPARDYLKTRGISPQTAKNWQMGYAPASGDILREWALEKKFKRKHPGGCRHPRAGWRGLGPAGGDLSAIPAAAHVSHPQRRGRGDRL